MTQTMRRIGLGAGAALLAVGTAVGAVAYAQNTPGGQPPFMGRRGPRAGMMGAPFGGLRMLGRRLDLTDPQKDQIKTILQSHRDEWKTLADRAADARAALDAAVTADTVDEAAIRDKSAALAAVNADMAVARARTRAELVQVLTPDQQAKLKALQAQREQRRQQMRQRFEQQGQGK